MNATQQEPTQTQALAQKRPSRQKKKEFELPGNQSIARCIRPKLEEYYSRRGSLMANLASSLDDAEHSRLIAEYDVVDLMKQRARADYEKSTIAIEEYFRLLKRYTKKQDRILSRVEKRVSFGPKCQNLIFILANLVVQKMRKLDPSVQEEYADGKTKTYTLRTSTRSLAKVLNQLHIADNGEPEEDDNNGEASFRGKSGLYAALLDSGFVLRKQNRKLNGEEAEDGFSVELTIDLDWIFGFSLRIPMEMPPSEAAAPGLQKTAESGNTTHLSYHFSKESTKASGVQNSAESPQVIEDLCQPNSELVQPTIVGNQNHLAKGQANKPPVLFSKENFAPAAPNFPHAAQNVDNADNALKIAEMVEKYALVACKSLVKEVYTTENFAKKRIRVNKITVYHFISPRDWESMMDKMFENYYFIQQKVGDWKQTNTEIMETIQKIGKYYDNHSSDYIYSPLHLLKTDMATRSLAFAHRLYFPADTDAKTSPKTANPPQMTVDPLIFVPETTEFEHFDWLVKERKEYSLSLVCYAQKLTKLTVDDAIRFVRFKYKRGFRSKNDIVAYTIGVIRNLDNTPEAKAKIKLDADEQVALHNAGIKIGEEFNRPKGEKGESASDVATPTNPLQVWVDKVKPIAIKVAKKYQSAAITPEKLAKVAERAMERGANDDQIWIWCEGIAKGTSKIF